MCLVIDTNIFHSVFDEQAKDHEHFVPVWTWLTHGKGKMIYGGKKYNKELKGGKFVRIVGELSRMGRLVKLRDPDVDQYAAELKIKVPASAFDDEHLVAIVAISKCCVVCTRDKKAFPYLKRKDLYPKGLKPPKIYQGKKNAKLCCVGHVVDACRDK
jgi:hypothetical protein